MSVEPRPAEGSNEQPSYNRDRVLRDSFNRAAWSLIAVFAAITVFVGLCVYSSSDGDKSSAVRNKSTPS